LGLIGIRKAHVPFSKRSATQRQELSDIIATVAMIYIVRAVTIKLTSRYEFLTGSCHVLQVFIQQLFCLNMQTATAYLQDATALDPQPKKLEGPIPKAISLRHRYKVYAAFSACAVQHTCIKMSLAIAGAVTLPDSDPHVLPELSPLLGVCLAMNMDQYWKYVVVECAEFGFSASSVYPRFSRQTVYDFYFGSPKIMRFKINGATDEYHSQFHGAFAESINGVTNAMLNQQGIAMHMFALSNTDQITEETYERRLSNYPLHICTIGNVLFENQKQSTCPEQKEWHEFNGIYLNYGTGDNSLINPPYGVIHDKRKKTPASVGGDRYLTKFNDECVAILSVMRLHLLSHVSAIKDMDVITSSTLLDRTSPPGLWCKLMRAPTHKRAVEKMLRMALLFNEMVADHLQKSVKTCIQKLLSASDPLSDTV
jgi:hypothetical protein